MMDWENWEELDFSTKKHYLKMIIENTLYSQIGGIQENPVDSIKLKEEKTDKAIEEFYEQNKEQFEISCIEEVIVILQEIRNKYLSKSNDENEER